MKESVHMQLSKAPCMNHSMIYVLCIIILQHDVIDIKVQQADIHKENAILCRQVSPNQSVNVNNKQDKVHISNSPA